MAKRGRPIKRVLTDQERNQLTLYASRGVPMEEIAYFLQISERTLWTKIAADPTISALYKKGVAQSNLQVASWLFDQCKPITEKVLVRDEKGEILFNKITGQPIEREETKSKGNLSAQIFWLKTRAKWSERLIIDDSPEEMKFTFDMGNLDNGDEEEKGEAEPKK